MDMRLRNSATYVGLLCVTLLAHNVRADTLADQLCIVDFLEYNQGAVAGMIGGGALAGGADLDAQIVDDFSVPTGEEFGFIITDVTFDYLAVLGAGAPPSTLIEIFPDVGGVPAEMSVYAEIHSTTSSNWTPLQPSFDGERHHASGLEIRLDAGRYWISMQPVTITGATWRGTGDLLFPVQNTEMSVCVAEPGSPTHFRESGLDPDPPHDGSLGFGPLAGGRCVSPSDGPCPDFTKLADPRIGLGDGESSFKVEGVPAPEPAAGSLALAAVATLLALRRRDGGIKRI